MYYERMRSAPPPPPLLLLALASASLFALYALWRLAWAEHLFRRGDASSLRQAVQLAPLNPRYWARLGDLRRAVELNPYFSSAWIQMGLKAESAGDLFTAEQCLLQAAKVDQTFEPRWTLANFYFRRQDKENFWKWLRLAAERSYQDRSALFRLAWRASSDAREILARALPSEPGLLEAYVRFLLQEGKLEAAAEAALHLAARAGANERMTLLSACERLLHAADAAGALKLWNLMAKRKLIPHLPLDAAGGVLLANPEFAYRPMGLGFDWRLLWRAGAHVDWIENQREIHIWLSGKQDELTELLEVFVPVERNRSYRMEFRYRMQDLTPASGVRWRVCAAAATPGGIDWGGLALAASTAWREDQLQFQSTSAGLARIALVYERQPGAVRSEGTLIMGGPIRLRPDSGR